jgi:cob(I)alamin adenosyltransferase
MAIYTRAGDAGYTSLGDGSRILKSETVFWVLGDLDELNSWLGVLLSSTNFAKDARDFLTSVQSDLFILGTCIANPQVQLEDTEQFAKRTAEIELLIDELSKKLPELRNFILPGGVSSASLCHVCRTVCRRVERRFTNLVSQKNPNDLNNLANVKYSLPVFSDAAKLLNRLSDLFFILARFLNSESGIDDIIWKFKH